MKKFIKDNIIKEQNTIVIITGGFQIINPSEETLIENGWKEYIEETNNDLNISKENMINSIKSYDSSENINVFYINDEKFWFSKEERNYLINRINAELLNNQATTTVWSNNIEYIFDIEFMKEILNKLELYASKCLDNTKRHINEVNNMTDPNEIDEFDYTNGYPEILQFYTK